MKISQINVNLSDQLLNCAGIFSSRNNVIRCSGHIPDFKTAICCLLLELLSAVGATCCLLQMLRFACGLTLGKQSISFAGGLLACYGSNACLEYASSC